MLPEGDAGLNIVSIGGGTGLSTLLSGLKHYVGKEGFSTRAHRIEELSAVVTVTDDGGSSGRLREEFQILPPGDIRNCMVALAEDEHLLTRLFQYRFESDGDLSGHSFGNLFLTALAGVTGDFLEAIKATSEVLAIKGRIFPSTTEDITLVAELEDGRVIEGETKIVEARSRVKRLKLSCEDCQPLAETLEAIKKASLITIGPGSLYTSILPNLLVDGIVEAIRESAALKVYICNVMTQPGETEGYDVEDHVRALYEYSPRLELDYVIVNSTPINPALREKYLADRAVQVAFKSGAAALDDNLRADIIINRESENEAAAIHSAAIPPTEIQSAETRVRVICGNLLNENDVVRHDPDKLANLLLELYRAETASDDGAPAWYPSHREC